MSEENFKCTNCEKVLPISMARSCTACPAEELCSQCLLLHVNETDCIDQKDSLDDVEEWDDDDEWP